MVTSSNLTDKQRQLLWQACRHPGGIFYAGRFQGPIAQTLVKRGLALDTRRLPEGGYEITPLGRDALALAVRP